MKIVIIGGHGTLGSHIKEALDPSHELICVGRSSKPYQVDINEEASIEKLFQSITSIDAIVYATGTAVFKPFEELTLRDYQSSILSKLLGQVMVAKYAAQYLNDRGSITLTAGILADDPIFTSTAAAMVNGGLHSFVKAASFEMPRGIRINVVSPNVLAESMKNYGPYFKGYQPVEAKTAALGYVKSIEGVQTGQIYRIGYSL